MKIGVSDDRPPLVPILFVGLLAGIVAVIAGAALGGAGMAASGLRSLLAIGAGLLVGLLLKNRVVALYQGRRRSNGEADAEESEEPESPD